MDYKAEFYLFWNGVIVKNFPKAKLKFKNESVLIRFLGKLLFFNRFFMTQYITVIGKTVYLPSKHWLEQHYLTAAMSIAHEFVHMYDVNPILYLFPQILSIFSLFSFLAIVNIWFLLFLSFLIFLVPWPAYWRTEYELNGYTMNLVLLGLRLPKYDYVRDAAALSCQFTDSSYYYMSWDRKYVIRRLISNYENLPETHKAFKEVLAWRNQSNFP